MKRVACVVAVVAALAMAAAAKAETPLGLALSNQVGASLVSHYPVYGWHHHHHPYAYRPEIVLGPPAVVVAPPPVVYPQTYVAPPAVVYPPYRVPAGVYYRGPRIGVGFGF